MATVSWSSREIAEGTFAASEIYALRSLPPAQQVQGFFNCWTRKEAYIKALGEGLTHPLDRFAVSLAPNEPAQLLNTVGRRMVINRRKSVS